MDLETKIRTADENLIFLPEKKTIVSVCTTDVRSYVCLFISRKHLLQNVLFSTSYNRHRKSFCFSHPYLFNQLNAKLLLQNQLF